MNRIYFLRVILILVSVSSFAQEAKKTEIISNSKPEKKVRMVGIPTISYNNSDGIGFGVIASGYYKINRKDTISPLSSSFLVGKYALSNTWFTGQFNKFYINEDKWRVKFGMGMGTLFFQTYVTLPFYSDDLPIVPELNADDNGEFVDYNTSYQFIFLEGMRKIASNYYLGARAAYSHSITEFELQNVPDDELSQLGIGIVTEFDTRDDQRSPTYGIHTNLKTLSFLESLGSTNGYTKTNIVYNHYFSMKDRNTILARFYGAISSGDVPFAGQNVVGRDDLRGYSNGKYRGDQVYAAQSEYRRWFSERWGFVAFGGVATAINSSADLQFDNLLPAVGAGIRFLAIPSAKINIGIDVAVGKDDWGLYFRIGEAFTR